ncbi:MAG: phenylalanine--tRNA ligase subunit beta [Alphaproteobacteria bacterium]|nr:phenylalanine--tRNA ligase subunit beta [Alphaproteobacteria bacterium]
MKFTLSWLKQHLETNSDIETILKKLTNIGLEVESSYNPSEALNGFIAAKIISTKPHPDADRLQLCLIDTGTEEIEIVCGAKNAKEGLTTIYAPVGSTIPASGMKLKKAKIRGIESSGMLCSEKELNLGDDSEGITELSDQISPGTSISKALDINDTYVEIAITPNRPDCLGIRGIARDLAAAGLGELIKEKQIKISTSKENLPVFIDTENNFEGCTIFAGRLIKNITNNQSPDWLVKRLESIGIKSINCLVDITNFINFDRGRPLHVYDANKINNKIGARDAKVGEKILALDGKDYELKPGICVIADNEKVLGIGGIMGGNESGSTIETNDVFIESAYFDPIKTALSGRALNIISDSRYRFERGVDPEYVIEGLNLATQMILDLCGGEAGEISLVDNLKFQPKKIKFDPKLVNKLTGIEIPNDKIVKILESLGFDISNSWNVVVPSWRPDIYGEADLVEEIVRIFGLDNIESEPLLNLDQPTKPILTKKQKQIKMIKRSIASKGLMETISYSFINNKESLNFGGGSSSLKIVNPISDELSEMRPTPLASLVSIADENFKKGYTDIGIFEVGPGFLGVEQDEQIIIASGLRIGTHRSEGSGKDWQGFQKVSVFDAKEDVISVLELLNLNLESHKVERTAPDHYHPGRSGQIVTGGGDILASFGELHPKIIKTKDFKVAVAFEIYIDSINKQKIKSNLKIAPEISNLQPLKRDFSFVVSSDTEAQTIINAAKQSDQSFIKDVKIFDQFLGENEKSIAIEVIIQPKEVTLTDEQIESISKKIIKSVEDKTKGKLRS